MNYMPTHYAGTFSGGRCVKSTVTPGRFIGAEESLIEARIARGEQCPDCSSAGTESNGSTEYRCRCCDHRWGFDGGPRGERYGF